MNEAQIASNLREVVAGAASAHKVQLGQGARIDVQDIIARTSREVAKLQPPDQAAKLLQAKAAFETLIETMVRARDQIPGYRAQHGGVIGEDTLAWARNILCPLWPICN